MIEREFEHAIGAKAVGSSHGDFGLVIQALDHTAGKQLLSPEVVEDEFAVLAEGTGDLLHGLDARPHGLATPFIEEFTGPGGRVVVPELLKGFLEKISPDGLQVVAEEITKPEVLIESEIVTAAKQEPAGFP